MGVGGVENPDINEDDFEEAIQKVTDSRKYSELDGDEFFVKDLITEYDEEGEKANEHTT